MHPYVLDLAELGAIAQNAQSVRKEVGGVDVLINNAGIVRGKFFWEHDNGEDTRPTMQVNALAPMYVTREFLPGMIESPREARVVNIASAAGTLANPRMSVYAASKWAVIGWSDTLRLELDAAGFRSREASPPSRRATSRRGCSRAPAVRCSRRCSLRSMWSTRYGGRCSPGVRC